MVEKILDYLFPEYWEDDGQPGWVDKHPALYGLILAIWGASVAAVLILL